jgi:hypothetical protein
MPNNLHGIAFPGGIYDQDCKSLDLTMPDLLQEQIDRCSHRSLVSDRAQAPVARVWLLADDATPDAIHSIIMVDAVELVLAGKSVLILAHRSEPVVDVREALLQALDLFIATQDVAGHA